VNSYAAEFGGTGGVEKLEPELAPNAPGRAGIRRAPFRHRFLPARRATAIMMRALGDARRFLPSARR
jgi:hypothetical protein